MQKAHRAIRRETHTGKPPVREKRTTRGSCERNKAWIGERKKKGKKKRKGKEGEKKEERKKKEGNQKKKRVLLLSQRRLSTWTTERRQASHE